MCLPWVFSYVPYSARRYQPRAAFHRQQAGRSLPRYGEGKCMDQTQTQGRQGVCGGAAAAAGNGAHRARRSIGARKAAEERGCHRRLPRETRLDGCGFFPHCRPAAAGRFCGHCRSHHQRFHRRPAQTDAGFDLFILGEIPDLCR